MKSILKIVVFSGFFLLLGCGKDMLIEDSPSLVLADNLYKDKAGFDAGLNGLYDEVRRSRSGVSLNSINIMMTTPAYIGVDNAFGLFAGTNQEGIFNDWGALNHPDQSIYRQEWEWLYETINAANTIVTRADNPEVLWTEQEKNQVLAEARAIRAWCYRHLTYLWGDVPLTLVESTGSNIKTDWERTPVADVRDAMEADWLFAEQYLEETSSNQGKILKGTVQHYLAELYLTEGSNDKAKEYALKVTSNPNYALITERYGVNAGNAGTPFTDMFLDGNSNRNEGNTEALWVMQAEMNVSGGEPHNLMRRYWVNRYYSLKVDGKNPFLISEEHGGRGVGRFGPTKWALSIYDEGDDRGSDFAWRFSYVINNPKGVPSGYQLGDTYYLDRTSDEEEDNAGWPSTRKWDYASPIDPAIDRAYNDQIYLRSADTYLLLAEAYFKLGDLTNAAAIINELRDRANAPQISVGDVTLDFILDERSRELFSEEQRRYTLLRTGKFLERLNAHNVLAKGKATDRDLLLPIPQSVIEANLNSTMPQNPGYD